MKKIFPFILVLCIFSCTTAPKQLCPSTQTIVEQYGKLSVKGTQLISQQGTPVALRGVSLGWSTWWSDFFNPYVVNTLVDDWHANLLRVAIGVEPEGSYIDNPELAWRCLHTAVDAAIKKGVYVIVDWHCHNIRLEEARVFFTRVATEYKDCPNVMYELFNEPDYETWEEVKVYSMELISTIRAIDPEGIILVGCPCWDQNVHMVADDPIPNVSNVMYTLHFYAATHGRGLRERGDYALSKGIPLFVSECAGMEATGDGPIDTEAWNTWVQWMNQRGLSWAAWSISGKNESCSMLTTTANPCGPWQENDLKEWAHIVRNRLRIDNP